MKKIKLFTNIFALILFSSQMVFAATFTTDFTTATNYTNDSEVEIIGGLAKLKESNIFSKASAYWKLNESSGILVDITGNGNDGTAINSPTYGAVGRGIDTVLEFNGVSQRVDIPHSSDVSMGHGTWEAWIYPTSFGDHAYHAIISKKYNTAYWFGLYQSTGRIQLWVGGTPKYTSTSNVVSLNTWSHVVATWDGSNIKFYINGSLVETIANANAIKTNTQNAGIGTDIGDSNSYEFTGRLGEVALYNGEVLSDAEVLWLYNNGLKKYYNGTVYKTSGNTDSNLSAFTSFNVTEGAVEGELRYQLSTDGSSWQYWDGSNWTNAGSGNYNTETEVDNNISSFNSSQKSIYVKTFLISNGYERVEVDKVEIGYNVATNTPTIEPNLIDSSDAGVSQTDNITSDNTPTFDIICAVAGNIITLYVDGTANGTHTCIGAGTEQITANPAITDGVHSITYTDKNTNGESGQSPVLSITIDTTAPSTPAVTSPTNSLTTNDTTPTFTGTGEAGATVTVTDSASPAHSCTATVDGLGNWSCDISPALSGGSVTFTTTQTDVAGNISSGTNISIIVSATSSLGTGMGKSGKAFSGKSAKKVCKDSRAINFSNVGKHKQSLCKYGDDEDKNKNEKDDKNKTKTGDENTGNKKLGKGYACPKDMWLYDNMKKGDRDGKYSRYNKGNVKQVKLLQAHMNRLGFRSGPEDGIFGPQTDAAIKRMQKYLGTFQDGIVGPITRSLINHSCSKPVEEKKEEQKVKDKKEEVKKEEKTEKLDTTKCPIFKKYFRSGDRDEEVKNIQIFLKNQEFNPGPIDAVMGPETISAIKAFQAVYSDTILKPWGLTRPTGRWYKSTRYQANKLAGCQVSVKLDNGKELK